MSTPTFKRISVEQFAQLLDVFPFSRRITSVHMHHTWKPRRADFDGHRTIVGMWRYHTQTNHWRDIAQHITIDPEGFIWLGRNWNLPPASAAGFNGNAGSGPFMLEVIGNFDEGQDPFDGAQRTTALKVVALVQSRFDLGSSSLMFHNAMSSKSCPGTSLDYAKVLEEVAGQRAALTVDGQPRRAEVRGPFPDEANLELRETIERLTREVPLGEEPPDAELSHFEFSESPWPESPEQGLDAARGAGLDTETLASMRPYLVNLSMGRLSGEGEARTTKEDVDAIFEQSLPAAIDKAKASGRKLQLLFFAHGGLVSEASGLRIAAGHIEWWKKNGIYPIYFVWETGLFETIGQLLKRARQGATRDIWDFTTDPIIEIAARALQGPRIWGGMKSSAEHAVDAPTPTDKVGGGAHYVATQLKALCDAHGDHLELYAVGHSAGAVFHSHFLTTARQLKVPTFKSAHFMAPAIRVDAFKEHLAPNIGTGKVVEHLTLFTMQRDYERRDDCANIYRKSLLYLIHHALEPQRATPILGLEESLRADAGLKNLFGLGGSPSALGEVIWSVSPGDSGRSASTSTSHGDFDNDAPTMNSIARRVLGKADADAIVEFPDARSIGVIARPWTEEVDWPEELLANRPPPRLPAMVATAPSTGHPPAVNIESAQTSYPQQQAAGGRRLALCVGIDRYPDPRHQLAGCVADARLWSDTLGRLGFTTSLLLDQDATRDGIERELKILLGQSRPGDVVVFQYAGHGTYVPDMDGDEVSGPDDQALCPVDFKTGALFIDDDLHKVLGQAPEGVSVTCFMDCCHSGSIIRFGMGAAALPRSRRDERQRYVRATPELIDAHARYRQKLGGRRSVNDQIRHVLFAACKESEPAWESNGHGEFTVHATQLLAAGIDSVSNAQFAKRVLDAFGPQRRQEPQLYCDESRTTLMLLQPLTEGVPPLMGRPQPGRLPTADRGGNGAHPQTR